MCKFCGHYKFLEDLRKSITIFTVDSLYTATHAFVDGEMVLYNAPCMEDIGFPINYCPECGKKLVTE